MENALRAWLIEKIEALDGNTDREAESSKKREAESSKKDEEMEPFACTWPAKQDGSSG
jgi:hypothetical protein